MAVWPCRASSSPPPASGRPCSTTACGCSFRKSTRRHWRRSGVGTRSGPRTRVRVEPVLSHWVEHMNFKGTRNIPRDQVKGIIEQFGGTWNGYTWVDQTTYLETASRDALDRMLFIEAERMSSCLYAPDDCESERTVIISELKGGENDPEQLLDIELTSAAFRVHPYQHPTIGWLRDLETMTRDDLYGSLSAILRAEQCDARGCRRRGDRRRTQARRASFWIDRGGSGTAATAQRRTAPAGRAPCALSKAGGRRPTGEQRFTPQRSTTPTSSRCFSSTPP